MPDDVLIIGAGAAGLAAAGVLERAGVRAVILEARERVGGRIHTIHPSSCAVPVELGAEFVHGRPPEIWEHVTTGRVAIEELKGERCYFEDGRIQRLDENKKIDELLAAMRKYTDPDRSLAEFLAECCPNGEGKTKDWAVAYFEGINAAPKEELSVRSLVMADGAAADIGGDALHRFHGGYDGLIGCLWADCTRAELRLGTVVQNLRWHRGAVTAECESGTFASKCAILTLPLGVLQAREGEPGYVRFDPEISGLREAAKRLQMGEVTRVTFEFRHRFWDWGVPTYRGRIQDLLMLYSFDPNFPTWWTSEPVKAPVITGWTSGRKARKFSSYSAEQISRDAAESLAHLLGVPASKVESEIVTSYLHDWQADPFARGAYSYVPPGCVNDLTTLGQQVEDTLFFAGEATHDGGRNATVDGAIATGRRAAEEVLRVLRRR